MSESPMGKLVSAGRRIGRYEIVRELGTGGMAAVYLARLRSMANVEKLFAIKVLLPHLREEKEFVTMFLDEARLAVLLDHPNVAHVFELGDDGGSPYIVMEYLRGQSLSALLRRADGPDRSVVSDLFLYAMSEAALGLHAAHELIAPDRTALEVVHRDVSPQNIHVAYDGRVRVVDFGIARARGRSTHTVTGQIKGKFRYCSPEQVTRPQDVDRRTDIWALGVMLWEYYARTPLFRDADEPSTLWNVMNKTVPRLRTVAPDVPDDIDKLVTRCLDREIEGRPRRALEVAKALRAVADQRGATSERLAKEMDRLFQDEISEVNTAVRIEALESRVPPTESTAMRQVGSRASEQPLTPAESEAPTVSATSVPMSRAPIGIAAALVLAVLASVSWWRWGPTRWSEEPASPTALASSAPPSSVMRGVPSGDEGPLVVREQADDAGLAPPTSAVVEVVDPIEGSRGEVHDPPPRGESHSRPHDRGHGRGRGAPTTRVSGETVRPPATSADRSEPRGLLPSPY